MIKKLSLLVALALTALGLGNPSLGAAEPGKVQSSNVGAVTVKVTPISPFQSDQPWRFEIIQDTHSVALTQDLQQAAVLIDVSGNEHQPTKADGDAPGGHHRKNTVTFAPLDPIPASVTLKIKGVGVPERSFAWPRGN